MSDYGLNFGFRRSDESSRSAAEGRYRTPVGSSLALGTLVRIDADAPGFLEVAPANTALETGFSGLLLQELDFERSIYESEMGLVDSYMKGVAKANRLAVITSGPGTKVWYKNTPQINRADGRVVPARTMATVTGLVIGDTLGWDGVKWVKNDATTTEAAMKVTNVDVSKGYFEATLQA